MVRLLTRRFDEQEGRCAYCRRGCKLRCGQGDLLRATLDHVEPKAGGGSERAWNKVMACRACRACNEAKGAMHVAHFLRLLAQNEGLPPGSKAKMKAKARRSERRARLRALDGLPAGSRKDRLPAAGWHLSGMAAGD